MTDHTPESILIRTLNSARHMAAEGHATAAFLEEVDIAIARTEACVNACKGIPTEQLGDVLNLIECLDEITRAELPERDNHKWREVVMDIKRNARAAVAPFLEDKS